MMAEPSGESKLPTPVQESPPCAVSVRNVSVTFRTDRGPLQVLENVSLEVASGEFVSLVGPSGSGKSTLLNVVSGLVKASSGEVDVFGTPQTGRDPRIGYMFQKDALLPWYSALKNVELGLKLRRVAAAERTERARAMLARVGLGGFENHFPHELSGGMRQRVALARTWITDPEILLMDEPFGALDSQMRLVLGDQLLSFWQASNKTVIFVTHDIDEAVALSDRVVVLSSSLGHIKSVHQIGLPRPRSVSESRSQEAFVHYRAAVWDDIRDEVFGQMASAK